MAGVRVILDSDVLLAGLRSRRGASFRVLQHLRAGRFEIALSVPLALEYEAELLRHASALKLRRPEVESLVDYLCRVALRQEIHFLWRPALTDPRDEFVVEVAVAAGCDAIVTRKVGGFQGASRLVPRVMSPSEFATAIEERP